jgi:hypothetical protein
MADAVIEADAALQSTTKTTARLSGDAGLTAGRVAQAGGGVCSPLPSSTIRMR